MKRTTHDLSEQQKQKIFYQYYDLIHLIYVLRSMALRKQIIKIYYSLYGTNKKKIEFMIAELIQKGFILQHQIENSRTKILYLSKWPRSQFNLHKETKDMEVLTFSKSKIYKHIFTLDYIIQKVIPLMQKSGYSMTVDGLHDFIVNNTPNLLLSCSQYQNPIFYERFKDNCEYFNIDLDEYEFKKDYKIARFDKQNFMVTHSKNAEPLALCKEKQELITDMDKCKTEIQKNRLYFSLNNFSAQHFILTSMYHGEDMNYFSIAYFDFMNTLQTQKFWRNLGFIYLMLKRYTNLKDIILYVDLWVWDNDRKSHLEDDFYNQKAYDFYKQEYSTEKNKARKILKDVGILDSDLENIIVGFTVNNIYEKYNINLN